MKKIFTMVMACFLFICSILVGAPSIETIIVEPQASDLIVTQSKTYHDGKKYSGEECTPHLDAKKFADFKVLADGGEHIDGEGNTVFSNYVTFAINLNFDKETKKIAGTDVFVSKDKCDWNDTSYANEGDTEQYIAYGAISAYRVNADGSKTKYEPMFSKGNTYVEGLTFNKDGDYTVYILFETKHKKEYQNHVLSWSFKIRSYVYVIDEATGFPIKESGLSDQDAVLDFAERQNLEVECIVDGETKRVFDGFVMSAEGGVEKTYRFILKNSGFICEIFSFVIDSKNPLERVLFSNLRKQIGESTYEAEDHFFFTWTDYIDNPITASYDFYPLMQLDEESGKLQAKLGNTYESGSVLEEAGLYYITVKIGVVDIHYTIRLVEKDLPSYNYGLLSAKRFNNFKTKWYQVVDYINGRVLCFDIAEQRRAYEAAMTIENTSVVTTGGRYFYNHEEYDNRIDLTAAMNENAFKNIQVMYYDNEDYLLDEESERTFSSAAFDEMVYLNDAFCFVSLHASETNVVTATAEDGTVYVIPFFTTISELNLPHGVYMITEADVYGNSFSYIAYRDLRAPSVTFYNAAKETVHAAAHGFKYTVKGDFSIADVEDAFDEYAVLRITRPNGTIAYFYQDEYKGITFNQVGQYFIKAYDRNNNIVEFSIEIN